MEYPGYSVYKSTDISESKIVQDADIVVQYLKDECKISLDRMIILGRSLGSGPAVHIASKYSVARLIIVSPFTSIQDVAQEHYGIFGKLLVKNRFNNLENIKKVKCQVLIIHGDMDELVPYEHAKHLQSRIEVTKVRALNIVCWLVQLV